MRKYKCIICRKELKHGIIINGRVICKSCEDRLVKADVETDFYRYYRDCIKRAFTSVILKEDEISISCL